MTYTISDRIQEVIEAKGYSRTEFADRINVTPAYITKIINKGTTPSNRLIEDICEKCGINETWLRTGEGVMQTKADIDAEISQILAKILHEDNTFRQRLISVLARMTPDEWAILERKLKEVLEGTETPPSE